MGDSLLSGIFFLGLLNVVVSSGEIGGIFFCSLSCFSSCVLLGFQYVTCGSAIKLANSENNVRLHSHDVKYGSGSGQQVK